MFQILKVNFHDLLSKITWQASISFCGPSSTMLLWTHCWSDIQSGKKSFKNVLFILVKHMPQQAGSHEMNPLIWKEPHSQTTCLCISKLFSYCSDNHAAITTLLTKYMLWHMSARILSLLWLTTDCLTHHYFLTLW